MQSLTRAASQWHEAQEDLRAIGLDVCETNMNWWLNATPDERRWWRGDVIEVGRDGWPDGYPRQGAGEAAPE